MDEKPISKELIKRYLDGTTTAEERALVETWHLQDLEHRAAYTPDADEISEVNTKAREVIRRYAEMPRKLKIWPRIAAVASVLLILSAGDFFLLNRHPKPLVAQNHAQDILPGTDKATLTLANGKKIQLTKTLTGTLALQGSTRIQMRSGLISYAITNDSPTGNKPFYNTLTTSRKEQFPLVLSDGTKVWLNSVSSISYPVIFTGKERIVKITGEAYFEVAHNASRPFKVEVNGQTIEDIGTAFNINAYNDEPVMRTTLISGSVKVVRGKRSVLLKPGQAAVALPGNSRVDIKSVDAGDAIAWKNGETLFDDEELPAIMRQVSRWYDVDIIYDGKIPERHFEGGISRKSNLSSLLKILELNDIHFTVDGNKIIIHP